MQQVGFFFQKGDFFMDVVHFGGIFKHLDQQPGHAAQQAVLFLQHGEKRRGLG